MPDVRRNLQVKQPNVEFPPEGNGWPVDLNDQSSPMRISVKVGKNGEGSMKDIVSTSQQREGNHHIPEGKYQADNTVDEQSLGESNMGDGTSDPIHTTQQMRGEVADPGGDQYGGQENNAQEGGHTFNGTSTSQQDLKAHHAAEGE